MSKKSKGSNLGRALIRDRFGHRGRRTVDNDSMVNFNNLQINVCLL